MLNLAVTYKTPDDEKPTLMRFLNIRDFESMTEFLVIFCRKGERKYLRKDYILEMTSTDVNRNVTAYGRTSYDINGEELQDFKEIRIYEFYADTSEEERRNDANEEEECSAAVGVNPDGSINMDSDYAKYVR